MCWFVWFFFVCVCDPRHYSSHWCNPLIFLNGFFSPGKSTGNDGIFQPIFLWHMDKLWIFHDVPMKYGWFPVNGTTIPSNLREAQAMDASTTGSWSPPLTVVLRGISWPCWRLGEAVPSDAQRPGWSFGTNGASHGVGLWSLNMLYL